MLHDEHLRRELRSRSEKARADLDEFERTKVHVALIREAGTGKSRLIDAIVGSDVAKVSAIGECTQLAQAVPHEESDGLVF